MTVNWLNVEQSTLTAEEKPAEDILAVETSRKVETENAEASPDEGLNGL